MKHLKQIAEIRSGHPFREKLECSLDGSISIVQMKDVTDSFSVDLKKTDRLAMSSIKERYLVESKDIVFRSRGQTNTCAIIPELLGTTIIAAPLFHISVGIASVLPEYLCWYINQPFAQSYFTRNARGTVGRMIGKDTLEELPVEIPSLEVQHRIIELAELAEREQVLMTKSAKKKKMLVSEILMQQARV